MARLFVFAIGGTGSRVVKSLTMLLAAGVKAKEDFEIVPIIIDPHAANKDLQRTVSLLENYQKVSKDIGFDSGFFATKISTLNNIADDGTDSGKIANCQFSLQDVSNAKFKDYISYNTLDPVNHDFVDLIFSGVSKDKEGNDIPLLDIKMDIGFVGNPNIGSVVLNQFKDSQEFIDFATRFRNGDRIFIISSIFGGTGAAGFPTILKNIRDAVNTTLPNNQRLTTAAIGALTVLPYFNIPQKDGSPIKESDFISKTKSALSYYTTSVNPKVNALYYIGDDKGRGTTGKNDPGAGGQQNDAHMVELFGALSIIDFLNIDNDNLQTDSTGTVQNPIYKQFGLYKDEKTIHFDHLESDTNDIIKMPLSQFSVFTKFMNEHVSKSLEKDWAKDKNAAGKSITQNDISREYRDIIRSFDEWLTEMGNNDFKPLNLKNKLFQIVANKEAKAGLIFKSNVEFTDLDAYLNKVAQGKSFENNTQKLTTILFDGTKEMLTKDFK